ncbi:hypothetical protein [Streptomyces sp. NBC_00009]|uniref:hypothetical protein n=1 Tax=Streptomyces sp. NBC_00009 TaxID=2975620 RepID=UPI0032532FCA
MPWVRLVHGGAGVGSFAVLDLVGHNQQLAQPAPFAGLASEWLDRVEAERTG